VDVSGLTIGKQLRAADLPFDPVKVKLVTDPQRVIAHVVVLKKEEEVAPAEVAAVTEAAPAEPEVIKKGKKEVEEGEEGAAPEKAEKPEKGKEKEKK
jgi:large subunit ribosomal protein L25